MTIDTEQIGVAKNAPSRRRCAWFVRGQKTKA